MLQKIVADTRVTQALAFLKDDNDKMLKELLELTQIPAFSNHEKVKAERMMEKFQAIGLEDVHMDEVWNVFGTLKGTKRTPKIMMAAHTDVVFPLDTDLTPTEKDGVWYAPGINDDTHGLADLLTIIRAIQYSRLQFEGDIIFCANVGEEGLGDLRGVKYIFGQPNDIAAFVSLDTPTVGGIIHRGTGSFRYHVMFTGRGGHSFADFGLPNPIHTMGRVIARIADFQVPDVPKTTFNVGVVDGGTSVNTIAAKCSFLLDIRSDSPVELSRLEQELENIVSEAVEQENNRWVHSAPVKAEIKKVGERPAGTQPDDCLIVKIAQEACKAIGIEPELRDETSTDANIPISKGIPALSVGRGGREGGVHTIGEWFDPTEAWLGPQKDLLMLLAMAGLAGVSPAEMPPRHNP